MDPQLEQLLRAILKSDPQTGTLSDESRRAFVYSFAGMMGDDEYKAVWQFSKSISDVHTRSVAQNWLSKKRAPITFFPLAEQIGRGIELPYYRWNAIAEVASKKLKYLRQIPARLADLREKDANEAFKLIREVQEHLPEVPEEDRPDLIGRIGDILAGAGRLDWAEEVVSTEEYCPERTNVLLRIAKLRLEAGEADHAWRIAQMAGELARKATGWREHPAYDLLEASELFTELGMTKEADGYLEEARVRAIADGGFEALKCLRAVSRNLAMANRIEEARSVANEITNQSMKETALQVIKEIVAGQQQS